MPEFFVVNGAPSVAWPTAPTTTPGDGGFVHGISAGPSLERFRAHVGQPVQVEAAEAFSAGAQLATNGSGRARTASTGDVLVATALERSGGTGDNVWVVIEPQRIL